MDTEDKQLSKSRCILLRRRGLSTSPGLGPKISFRAVWQGRLGRFWSLAIAEGLFTL